MTDRSLVKSISFYSDNRVIDGTESYDVSEEQNGSVKMYVKQNGENNSLYDLTIVGNGIIAFPEDSSNLLSFNVFDPCSGPLSNLTLIDFNNSIDTSSVIDMSYMFVYNRTDVIDLSNFNTSNVANMDGMFSYSDVTTLDLSNFDTSKVTNMSNMFYGSQATTLDLSNFDTSKVTNMSNMFNGSKATTINVSSFNTSKVTDMWGMFNGSKATTINVSSFNTSNVTNMGYMFRDSTNLKTIYASSKYNTSKVISSGNMFTGCTSLVGGQGTVYDSTKVDKTYARIDGGTSSPGYFTSK